MSKEEIKFDKNWIIPILLIIILVGLTAFVTGMLFGHDKGFDAGWEGCEDWYEKNQDTIKISIDEINVNHDWNEIEQGENKKISSNKNG